MIFSLKQQNMLLGIFSSNIYKTKQILRRKIILFKHQTMGEFLVKFSLHATHKKKVKPAVFITFVSPVKMRVRKYTSLNNLNVSKNITIRLIILLWKIHFRLEK